MRAIMSRGRDTRRQVRFLLSVLAGAISMGAYAMPLAAQEIGDAAAGRTLAETWCKDCHAAGLASQPSPRGDAPTFIAISRMKSTTRISLQAFLQTPHNKMPDIHLSREEIDDIAAYILSLRRK